MRADLDLSAAGNLPFPWFRQFPSGGSPGPLPGGYHCPLGDWTPEAFLFSKQDGVRFPQLCETVVLLIVSYSSGAVRADHGIPARRMLDGGNVFRRTPTSG